MAFSFDQFLHLVKSAVSREVSDIHIRSGERPCFRLKGDLVPVKAQVYDCKDIIELAEILVKDENKKSMLEQTKELDGSFEVKGLCRIRYNFLRYQGKVGLILRLINAKIPTIDELELPSVIRKISLVKKGLVLVTGATGSGKSSTLAAMINHINENCASHILTLEDPVEFVHTPKKSRITQREVGEDTDDFGQALRSALRQDPDIILIGEMRDAETISIAIKAAETGHLVFGTVHTTDALNTVGRLISMFPAQEQDAVRARIADNLYATISQRLLKKADGSGRVAAQEIMITSPGIRESISDASKIEEIYTYIRKGKKGVGMQSFDQHLTDLYKAKKISLEQAKAAATSPEDFERNLMFGEDSD